MSKYVWMYDAFAAKSCTVFTVGSLIADAAAAFTGSAAAPEETSCFCTSVPVTYLRNSTHAVVASVVHENPSAPPRATSGAPWPPSPAGNGSQPSLLLSFLSDVRDAMVPGSQVPCSSIAALPLATMPAELPAPCCAGVPRKPAWNGFVSRNACMSSLALAKHGALRSWLDWE